MLAESEQSGTARTGADPRSDPVDVRILGQLRADRERVEQGLARWLCLGPGRERSETALCVWNALLLVPALIILLPAIWWAFWAWRFISFELVFWILFLVVLTTLTTSLARP